MNWNYGLELARCIAIVLVLISHGIHFLNSADGTFGIAVQSAFYYFLKPGWWGVRIFFTLSGYLIGAQAIKILNNKNIRDAIHFTFRRWLRTIPTYWILLAAACLINNINFTSSEAISNAFFVQTINPESASASSIISVSWSLAIEEWSYLIVSALIVILTITKRRKSGNSSNYGARKILFLALVLAFAALTLRTHWSLSSEFNWGALKKTAPLQIDSLSAGLALAGVQALRPGAFAKLCNQPISNMAISITLMGMMGFIINEGYIHASSVSTEMSLILSIILYPASSLLSALFLVSLWNYKPKNPRSITNKICGAIAATSYSLYMTHLWAMNIIERTVKSDNPYILFVAYIFLSFVIGLACWLIAELPFLKVRDRLKTTKK